MKILYTTDQIYLHGGIEKVLSQKANYLADVKGEDVYIITHGQKDKIPVYNFSNKIKLIDLGINYTEGQSYFHPQNIKKAFRHRKKLQEILKKICPDILISCSFGTDFFFLPFLEKKTPKIKEFHASRFFSSTQNSLKKRILEKISAFMEKKYDYIVVLNPDEAKFYNSKRISVIPNPTEKTEYCSNYASKKILAAGRISPVKNFKELIEIWKEIISDFPDWELHFFGEDYLDTQKNLKKLVYKYKLQKNVKFMGITENLKEKMQDYSIYVMTSITECFPMVLLESLSVGLPVISYDSPTGPKFIITNDSDSYIIPYKNVRAFEEKLSLLMKDVGLRREFGKNAKQNAKRFAIENVMQQWEELFRLLINKKKRQDAI